MDFLAWPALGLFGLIRITWQSSLGQAYQTVASSNLISLLPVPSLGLPAASLDTKQVLPLKLSTKEDNAHKVKRSVSPHQQVPMLAPPQSHTQHHHAGIAAHALNQTNSNTISSRPSLPAALLILVLIDANKRVAFSTWANLTPPSHIPLWSLHAQPHPV